MPRIRHLFVSPGHNYFGHHGGPAGEHPIEERGAIECEAGQGIVGDRFFGYKEDYKGQITLFSWEVFCSLRTAFARPDLSPAILRRNVVVEGADLKSLIGRRFQLQGVELEGVEECRPCYWMDQALAPGAEDWMKGRGGLRCRLLSSGTLTVDPFSTT
jgi:MOSC domain-containing protein YiiM